MRSENDTQTSHMTIRGMSYIEATGAHNTITKRGGGESCWYVREDRSEEILLDNEVNLSVNTISQMNFYALVDPDRSTVADDENTPSPNAVEGGSGGSFHVNRGWYGTFVVDRCGSVVDGVDGCAGGSISGIRAAVRVPGEVGTPGVRRGIVGLPQYPMGTSICSVIQRALGSPRVIYTLDNGCV